MIGVTLIFSLLGGLVTLSILAYLVLMYNGLIRLRKNIDKAWRNIDVLLKQRSDELPKLIDTVKQYIEYERDVLQNLTDARTKAEQASTPKENAKAEESVKGALGNLFAVAEDYPKLQASDRFQQLQERISALEEKIADRREFYNDSVTTYNIRINQIPYNLVANILNYKEKELFEVKESEREDIDISKSFEK